MTVLAPTDTWNIRRLGLWILQSSQDVERLHRCTHRHSHWNTRRLRSVSHVSLLVGHSRLPDQYARVSTGTLQP
eukprot:s1984_g2.t1